MKRLLCGAIALASLALLLAGAALHPFAPYWPAALVLGWVLVMWLRPAWWMTGYLALLPVLDLTMFSGWLFFEDFDFVTLSVIAAGYARFALARSAPLDPRGAVRLVSAAGAILIAAYGISLLASGAVGILPLAPLDANAFSNYFSRYNALRLAKAPFAAMLLLPLVLQQMRVDRTQAARAIVAGMVAGLSAAGLSVLWERVAFVDLTDLAVQYRVTGMFSGTHTGGAALDGYLAMTLPFCVLALLRADSRRWLLASAIVLVLGCYSVLVTFSRALYAAVALAITVQVLLYGRSQVQPLQGKSASPVRAALMLAGLGAFAYWNLGAVFDEAGYRGLAVTGGSFLALYFMTGTPLRPNGRMLGFLAGLALASMLLAMVPKGAYLAYALCVALFLWVCFGKPGLRLQYGWASVLGLSANALLVSGIWSGQLLVLPVALGLGVAWALALANAYSGQRLWRISAASLPVVLLGGLGLGTAIVTTHSYYASARLAASDFDMGERTRHYGEVLGAADHDGVGSLLGAGLGRMPETYFWRSGAADVAGTYAFVDENDNRFLRLLGPRNYAKGFGDSLRFMQAIRIDSPRLKVTMDARTPTESTGLRVKVCVRHLLYTVQCADGGIGIAPGQAWQRYQVDLDLSRIAVTHGGLPRPVFLVLNTETQKAQIDIDNVSIEGSAGETISNGGFSHGMDHWFFTSDRSHLAWHAKNVFLHVFFEQGAVGLALFGLMLVGAFVRLWRPLVAGHHGATALVTSLAAFIMVGMFDSLLDVPRISLLFYLLLFAGLAIPRRLVFDKVLQNSPIGQPG